tara:strand:- start:595 stop:852 length:258 start_codon:yes stop_codon:yes gene_type:complete
MSHLLHEIVKGVDEEIAQKLPTLTSEISRREMRKSLLALEKMTKHIRKELLKESKQLASSRKAKRNNKNKNKKIIKDDNIADAET